MSWDIGEIDPAEALATLLRPFPPNTFVCPRLGEDSYIWFTEHAFRSSLLVACRIRVASGPEAVSADSAPGGLEADYRRLYGEFSACYDLEHWYAPFGGPRRRILAHLLPGRAECLRIAPPLPADYAPPKSWAEVEASSRAKPEPPPKAPEPKPTGRRKVAAGQMGLF